MLSVVPIIGDVDVNASAPPRPTSIFNCFAGHFAHGGSDFVPQRVQQSTTLSHSCSSVQFAMTLELFHGTNMKTPGFGHTYNAQQSIESSPSHEGCER